MIPLLQRHFNRKVIDVALQCKHQSTSHHGDHTSITEDKDRSKVCLIPEKRLKKIELPLRLSAVRNTRSCASRKLCVHERNDGVIRRMIHKRLKAGIELRQKVPGGARRGDSGFTHNIMGKNRKGKPALKRKTEKKKWKTTFYHRIM
jgi:hypothetical protein